MKEIRHFSSEELKHLLTRCLSKDEEAWEILFHGIYGYVKNIVLRVGILDEDVDDAVAQSFLDIVHSITEVAQARNPFSYIGAMARYSAYAVKRKRTQTKCRETSWEDMKKEGSEDDWVPSVAATNPQQGENLMNRKIQEELNRAVQSLKPNEARLLRYKYIDDFSYEEISYIVNKDSGAARVSTHRAVQRLKEMLKEEIREMIREKPEILQYLQIPDLNFTISPEPDSKLKDLLERYLHEEELMPSREKEEIEEALSFSTDLREWKVRIERQMQASYDVSAHAPLEPMPENLLNRLMDEVRKLDI